MFTRLACVARWLWQITTPSGGRKPPPTCPGNERMKALKKEVRDGGGASRGTDGAWQGPGASGSKHPESLNQASDAACGVRRARTRTLPPAPPNCSSLSGRNPCLLSIPPGRNGSRTGKRNTPEMETQRDRAVQRHVAHRSTARRTPPPPSTHLVHLVNHEFDHGAARRRIVDHLAALLRAGALPHGLALCRFPRRCRRCRRGRRSSLLGAGRTSGLLLRCR